MKFNLSLHIIEIQREENEYKYSLSDYVQFIRLTVDLITHMPQFKEGAGKTQPPFQTIKHNFRYLKEHFPLMREKFAEEISEEINFKFKDITEEMVAQINVKKEEKRKEYERLSNQQKKSVDSILDLLSKVSKSTRIATLFDAINEKSPQQTKQSLNLHNLHSEENCETKALWRNADEILSKLKMNHLKPIQLAHKIAV